MSRASHDFECFSCGSKGKVPDDVIICPKCGASIEGVAIAGIELEKLINKINERKEASLPSPMPSKEGKN